LFNRVRFTKKKKKKKKKKNKKKKGPHIVKIIFSKEKGGSSKSLGTSGEGTRILGLEFSRARTVLVPVLYRIKTMKRSGTINSGERMVALKRHSTLPKGENLSAQKAGGHFNRVTGEMVV